MEIELNKIVNGATLLKTFFLFLVLLCSPALRAQNLILTAVPTPATCPGNGALTLSVQNAAPTGDVLYTVYLLPNTTTPSTPGTLNSYIPGQVPGDYKIVATQNGNTSDPVFVTITDDYEPLHFNAIADNALCGADGSIHISTYSGNPVSYEIISGPQTRPPQSSSTFNNLPAGTYNILVTDACGFTEPGYGILFTDGPILYVGPGYFPDVALPACDLITVSNNVSPAPNSPVDIALPLTATLTVYPPDGSAPIVFPNPLIEVLPGGPPTTVRITQVIPYWFEQDYYYSIDVVDPCGDHHYMETNPQLINERLSLFVTGDNIGCGHKNIIVNASKYGSPYYLNFVQPWPAGFDPVAFNAQYPGPYTDPIVTFGEIGNPPPFGTYNVEILDACGHPAASGEILLEFPPDVEIETSTSNTNCTTGLGSLDAFVPNFIAGTATITEAPQEYIDLYGALDSDVSAYINDKGIVKMLAMLPPGEYAITITDTCGYPFPAVPFTILEYPGDGLFGYPRPDCTPGKGSVYISGSSPLTSLQITVAPPEFATNFGPTPYDVTNLLIPGTGRLFMDNLPPGSYSFAATTECDPDLVKNNLQVPGYAITTDEYVVTRHCGSFDLFFNHQSNATSFLVFALQVKNQFTGEWVNPATGNPVPADEEISEDNSYILTNNTILYSLTFQGDFRIVKMSKAYGPGSADGSKICIQELYTFPYYDRIDQVSFINLTCTGTVADIQANFIGAEPLTYEIVQKDGAPFYIDYGTNNVFTGLEMGVYVVLVSDPCGRVLPFYFNIAQLPSLVSATTLSPAQILAFGFEKCDEGNDGTEEFDLTQANDTVLAGQDTSLVTLTYHNGTLADAQAGLNPITQLQNFTSGSGTIYARVVRNSDLTCYAIAPFDLKVNPKPVFAMEDLWPGCLGETVTIIADSGNLYQYKWSTGATTQSITVDEEGDYTVKVTNEYGCEEEKTVTVVLSVPPALKEVVIADWTDRSNSITAVVEPNDNSDNFEYSIDLMHWQSSPTFTGLVPGHYNVFVRDKYGCGDVVGKETYLLNYPKFFTPNGDNINETWRIEFGMAEPNMQIYIYDRYGKLITAFGPNYEGWDGTYNGARLPSTDYWFVVKRQDGRELKGHFSMIR